MLDRQSLSLQVVQCAGNENQILIHDEQNKVQAQLLAEMKGPNFPIAVGVLYKEERVLLSQMSTKKLMYLKVSLVRFRNSWKVGTLGK